MHCYADETLRIFFLKGEKVVVDFECKYFLKVLANLKCRQLFIVFTVLGDDSLPCHLRVLDYMISSDEHDYSIDDDDTMTSDVSSMEDEEDDSEHSSSEGKIVLISKMPNTRNDLDSSDSEEAESSE